MPDCCSSEGGATLELRDIKDLLVIRDTGVCSGEPAEELCAADLLTWTRKLDRLSALREQIVAMVEALPSQHCGPPVPGSLCPPENHRR